MNILIANDDGIFAKGIHVLADALAQMDDVNLYIIGPDKQRSCCGHALTLFDPVNLTQWDTDDFNKKVKWAYACSGVPADCARIGIYMLKEQGVHLDLVCTGINQGSNWGSDVYYSGTLAAARESSICYTQAIAFSVCDNNPTHFEYFYDFVPQVIDKAYGKLPYTTILNVNVPDLPVNELKGVKVCKQGPMDYGLGYKTKMSNACGISFEFDGGEIYKNKADKEWDCVVGREGFVTLTPVDLMPYNRDSMNSIEALGINL